MSGYAAETPVSKPLPTPYPASRSSTLDVFQNLTKGKPENALKTATTEKPEINKKPTETSYIPDKSDYTADVPKVEDDNKKTPSPRR